MAIIELYPHQSQAVDLLANGKILRGDPGVGKTITALSYFFTKECGGTLNDWGSIKTPKHLYIITTAKKRNDGDWQKDAYMLGLMEDPEISVGGIKVTVDSWNNIEKYEDVKDAFFIFDEQKVVGSGVWAKTFVKVTKNNRWILLSATPGDIWLDFVPVFLANGFYKNRTEFKDRHVVYASWSKFPKVERYIHVNELMRNRAAVLVEMVYKRHTIRHVETIEVGVSELDMERVTKHRWHIYEDRPIRDVAELFAVSRKVSNSDPSRLEAIRALQKKHKRLIVFYNFDYELELLRTLATESTNIESPDTSMKSTSTTNNSPKTSNVSLITSSQAEASEKLARLAEARPRTQYNPTGVSADNEYSSASSTRFSGTGAKTDPPSKSSNGVIASIGNASSKKQPSGDGANTSSTLTVSEWNGHKHQPVPTTDEWIYLVQYRAGAEAWNCITTDAMVFYSMTYSYKDFEQSQGRIDRINTKYVDLWYYVLMSEAWIDQAIKRSLDDKQDFNEKRHRIYSDADLGIKDAA